VRTTFADSPGVLPRGEDIAADAAEHPGAVFAAEQTRYFLLDRHQPDGVSIANLKDFCNCSGRFSAITSTYHRWRGDQSGPHSPLCGSASGDTPSAQGTVRTTFADIPGVLPRGEDIAADAAEHPGAVFAAEQTRYFLLDRHHPGGVSIANLKDFRNCSGRFPAITRADHLSRGDQSGPHSPLCGSESGDAPSAQRTAR